MDFLLNENYNEYIKKFKFAGLAVASLAVLAYLFSQNSHDSDNQQQYKGEQNQKKPAGIFNEGNTCFVNSLLQGLASLKLFKRNLELMFEEVDHKVSDDEALLFELKNALEKINSEEDKVDIVNFLDILGALHANIINLEQQDAHELYSILISSLDNVLGERKRMTLTKSNLSTKSQINLEETLVEVPQNNIENPLLGYTKTSFTCSSCRVEKNIKIQPFYDLSFDIAPKEIGTLDDAIKHFQAKEVITGWICTKCSIDMHLIKLKKVKEELEEKQVKHWQMLADITERIIVFCTKIPVDDIEMKEVNSVLEEFVISFENQYAMVGSEHPFRDRVFSEIIPIEKVIVKQTIITKFPKILVFHFKQLSINPYTGEPYLLRKFINFPDLLTIPVRNRSKEYKLTSLLSHIGNEAMGHYYTFRKINQQENEWYMISDTSTRRCRPEFLRRNIPYMLFYELKIN